MENKKVIVAVSGGPDSMYLLNYLLENNFVPIVAHVNYNFRPESIDEKKYIEEYCKLKNIKIYIKDVKEKDLEKYSHLKNKQSMARELRYDFFKEVSTKEKVSYIYIGHHKDDFIETAIMQSRRSNDYFFYGIQEETKLKGMIIRRPLLNLFKDEIVKFLKENNIKYFIDKTNNEPIYERNKIRIELKNKTQKEKDKIYYEFKKKNDSMKKEQKVFECIYQEFIDSKYSWNYFDSINPSFKNKVIYKFLIDSKDRININKNKIDSLLIFLENKRGNKEYRLMKNTFILIKSSRIIILSK